MTAQTDHYDSANQRDGRSPIIAPRLSAVEIDVLCGIADGLSDLQVAARLVKSVHTIRSHRDTLLAKTGANNRVELARYAVAAGHVPPACRDGEREQDESGHHPEHAPRRPATRSDLSRSRKA